MDMLMKAEEVMEVLQISRSTLARWVAGKRLRRIKLSARTVRFDPKDVYRLVESKRL